MRRQLQIAELVVTIESNGLPWAFDPRKPHDRFEVERQGEDVHVVVHRQPFDGEELGEEIFSLGNTPADSPRECHLYRSQQGAWRFEVTSGGYPAFRRRIAVFEPDFARGELYIELFRDDLSVYPYPLDPPLDRVLFAHLMAYRSGMLLHGCGVIKDGYGYLFAGPSGAGKTTLARLWSAFDDVTVLGEECLALRKKGSRFWVYGTPWAGEFGQCSPQGAPIRSIYFVRHASENTITPIPARRALELFLTRSFLMSYDVAVANMGLDLALGLMTSIPAFDFGFLPDSSAVQLIRDMH